MKTGQCLCGEIKYKIKGEIIYTEACHCIMCQRISGGAFQIWMKCKNDELELIHGTPKDFKSSCNVIRQSCPSCSSHLFFRYIDRKNQVYITATSLDFSNDIKPNMHIWLKRKLSWLKLSDEIPTSE